MPVGFAVAEAGAPVDFTGGFRVATDLLEPAGVDVPGAVDARGPGALLPELAAGAELWGASTPVRPADVVVGDTLAAGSGPDAPLLALATTNHTRPISRSTATAITITRRNQYTFGSRGPTGCITTPTVTSSLPATPGATPRSTVTAIDELLKRNQSAALSHPYWLGPVPTMHIAVVLCMDARVDTYRAFGLGAGEVHLVRNAGGVVTEDVIRSLAISQHALGTREVMIVHHTDCGLARLEEDAFRDHLAKYAGYRPTWAVQAFKDPHDSVRESILRVETSPFLLHTEAVRGFVFDVKSGLLEEVTVAVPENRGPDQHAPDHNDQPGPGHQGSDPAGPA